MRSSNQDAFGLDNQIGLWVVADGMGGHAGGDIASDIAVSIITKEVRSALAGMFIRKYRAVAQRADLLREAVAAAGAEIQKRASIEVQLSGMGTTVVAALWCSYPSTSVVIGHLGDSRAYLIRRQTIAALTTDHSLVVDLLRAGKLTDVEARKHPQRHVLSNALGLTGYSAPDIAVHPLEPDDQLLLCTDGLTKMLSEAEILAAILTPALSDAERCGALIDHANGRGGEDNTTVLLITPRSNST
jgi:protein phosphatase